MISDGSYLATGNTTDIDIDINADLDVDISTDLTYILTQTQLGRKHIFWRRFD